MNKMKKRMQDPGGQSYKKIVSTKATWRGGGVFGWVGGWVGCGGVLWSRGKWG